MTGRLLNSNLHPKEICEMRSQRSLQCRVCCTRSVKYCFFNLAAQFLKGKDIEERGITYIYSLPFHIHRFILTCHYPVLNSYYYIKWLVSIPVCCYHELTICHAFLYYYYYFCCVKWRCVLFFPIAVSTFGGFLQYLFFQNCVHQQTKVIISSSIRQEFYQLSMNYRLLEMNRRGK